jgi:uncharacterized protein (DUF4415 family)
VRESRTPGSVRGDRGNPVPYRVIVTSGWIAGTLGEQALEFFRQQGRGYQTRMNAVLRAYYDAHQQR